VLSKGKICHFSNAIFVLFAFQMPDFRNSSTLLADRSEEVRSSSLIEQKKKTKRKRKTQIA